MLSSLFRNSFSAASGDMGCWFLAFLLGGAGAGGGRAGAGAVWFGGIWLLKTVARGFKGGWSVLVDVVVEDGNQEAGGGGKESDVGFVNGACGVIDELVHGD